MFDIINDCIGHESSHFSLVYVDDFIGANAFKEAPAKCVEHISELFTMFHVPCKIMMSSMLPLIKYTHGDITSSYKL